MPQISNFYGIIIKMFWDDHNPPHFHVDYSGDHAIIEIMSGRVNGTLPRRALSLVYEWLDLHKDELMKNWELMKDKKQPNLITPLD